MVLLAVPIALGVVGISALSKIRRDARRRKMIADLEQEFRYRQEERTRPVQIDQDVWDWLQRLDNDEEYDIE